MIGQAISEGQVHAPVPAGESYNLSETAWRRVRNSAVFVALASWLALLAGYALDPRQFFFSYLFGYLSWTGILLAALFFTMVQHLTGSAWSVTVRRFMEALSSSVAACAILFLPVVAGLHELYEWTHKEAVQADPVLRGKAGYLNEPFFLLRAGAYFLIWILLARTLYHRSVRQDGDGDLRHTAFLEKVSAPGAFLLFVSATLASFDWAMSLEPHWFSTIFGVYLLSGGAMGFFAVLILIALAFRKGGYLRHSINQEHYHDLGKWLFAMTVFWAYIAFSQYMLIWYANLPEETFWFHQRREASWGYLGWLLVVGHFLFPFFVLLGRAAKRNLRLLGWMAGWLLLMHLADVYFIVMPVLHRSGVAFHWLDAAAVAGTGSIIAVWFWAKLRRAAIVPTGDPRLEECLHLHNA